MTLWAGIVAERLGFDHHEALTLGRAVGGLDTYSKGGVPRAHRADPGRDPEEAAAASDQGDDDGGLAAPGGPGDRHRRGLRALSKDEPINPTSVEGYLESKFGEALAEVRAAMTTLAREFNLAEPTLAP
jgi:hypothetical protein